MKRPKQERGCQTVLIIELLGTTYKVSCLNVKFFGDEEKRKKKYFAEEVTFSLTTVRRVSLFLTQEHDYQAVVVVPVVVHWTTDREVLSWIPTLS